MSQEANSLCILLSTRNNIYIGTKRSDFQNIGCQKTDCQIQLSVQEHFFQAVEQQSYEFRSDFFRLLALRVDIYLGRKNRQILENFGKTLRILREKMQHLINYVDDLVKQIAKVLRSKIQTNYKKLKATSKRKKSMARLGWIEI